MFRLAMLLFCALLPATAAAQERALTFSYRAMVGASARYEAPVLPGVVALAEGGVSSWLIYGDDPTAGGNQSPVTVRPHVKLGGDVRLPDSNLFLGARVLAARNEVVLNDGVSNWELAPQITAGAKSRGPGTRLHVGFGIGPHRFVRADDAAWIWMPHVELRLGHAWPTK
jgi:hypothetical protein